MPNNLQEKKSADGVSMSADAVTPEGGNPVQSSTGADLKKKVDPKAGDVKDGVTKVTNNPEKVVESEDKDDMDDMDDEEEMEENFGFDSVFEGMDLSEEFKAKASLVFEAAVNEAAVAKAKTLSEEIEKNLQEEFETTLSESLNDIVENLDGYLDYIVKEWMEENVVAIEAGIKVDMAESFMAGLKELFEEHNVEVNAETVDVVEALEEEISEIRNFANKAIDSNIKLEEELQELRASKVFDTMTEGLSAAQVERFRVLSEKLKFSDVDGYTDDLKTLKESFFKTKATTIINEDLDKEGEELIVETAPKKNLSSYDSVNAYAEALKNLK
jgi:hypothetical protein